MKINDIADKQLVKTGAVTGLLMVIIAAVTLEATALIQYLYSQKQLKQEASLRAESQLEATKNRILDITNQAESAVRNNTWIAQWCLNVPDSLYRVTQRIVEDNPSVVGSAIALVPDYYKDIHLLAPYTARRLGTYEPVTMSLAGEEYNYPEQEWFKKGLENEQGYWSEPYVDEGGGGILMTTFSLPIKDASGRTAAVLTADLSLDWLSDLVGNVKVYPNAYSMMISRSGQFLVCPVETLVMHQTIQEVTNSMEDTSMMNSLSRSMLNGETGNQTIRYKGATSYVYFSPVERTGWSMSIVIPENEIFGSIRRAGALVGFLQLLGLVMLVLIIRAVILNALKFREVDDKKKRMEGELHIANAIQMAMIPKASAGGTENEDADLSASITPAKEVGGDFYDYYFRDQKLFFCIGDVSGKGVPAALVMAVSRSLFRTISAHESSPKRLITAMNDFMSDTNENNMFVTLFCGILDLTNGRLRYCNAGHNPPIILTNSIQPLPVRPNLPLGVMHGMCYEEQEVILHYDDALFLYTDGLTEAENPEHELFGEERMKAVLHTRRDVQAQLEAMQQAVADFVGTAPKSDDLTMMFIHYMNKKPNSTTERSLTLNNDIQQIARLAEFTGSIAEDTHMDNALAMGINLALEEAITNVIMYAYPQGKGGQVQIDAVIREGSLDFIISDTGIPFDPTAAPEADTSLGVEDRPIGGLGIFLVRKIMDKVSYRRENGKNILSMTKFL